VAAVADLTVVATVNNATPLDGTDVTLTIQVPIAARIKRPAWR